MSTLGYKPLSAIVDAAGNPISGGFITAPTAAVGAQINLLEATANGVNTMTIQCPALLAANRTITMSDASYVLPAGVGNASTLMDLQTVQTVSGAKTFTPGLTFGVGSNLTAEAAGVGAYVDLREATANGVNRMRIQGFASLAADRAITWSDRDYNMADIASRAELITLAAAGAQASIALAEDANNGVNTMSIRPPALLAANRTVDFADATYTFPAGVGNASTIQDLQTAQTVSGAKIFTPGLTFGVTSMLNPEAAGAGATLALAEATANGTNTMTLTCPAALAANRTITMSDASYTLPAGVANASSLLDAETAQNISSTKTLVAGGGLNLGSGAGTLGLTGGFYIGRGIAATGGAQTQAHGLGRVPSFFDVVLDGNGVGCLITLVAADINNVTWTTSAAAGTVRVLAM